MSAGATSNEYEKPLPLEEQQAKINEVKKLLGPLSGTLSAYCSDASIARYLRAWNWNVSKATKMLKDTLKWRVEYKPEEICWDEIAREAETGKIYRSNYIDKYGRTVLVMRPCCQNTKLIEGQIRYFVYCLENAILNLPPEQEQIVWLTDFQGFNLSHVSMKLSRQIIHILQDHYPERLGLAIMYNPPKFFQPFWTVMKPFLQPKMQNRIKFVYPDNINSMKIMESLFDMEQLECSFGGNDSVGFDINKYAERMREDEKKIQSFWATEENPSQGIETKPVSSALTTNDD